MALYSYYKENNSIKKRILTYFSYASLTIGSFLLFWAFYPIISFEIYSQAFLARQIKSPIINNETNQAINDGLVLGKFNIFSNNLSDFTNANFWFPSISKTKINSQLLVKDYLLSIPKLNIKEARVLVGGEDLAKSLIHYLPKTMPGEPGNVVIFGHSTLPQLYQPNDYKSIFTFLPSLQKGDKIFIKVNDVIYQYEIFEMFVIEPTEVSVLDQQFDASYLTLITCVPPGTFWKRLVVKAKLVPFSSNSD
jgi:sortase A